MICSSTLVLIRKEQQVLSDRVIASVSSSTPLSSSAGAAASQTMANPMVDWLAFWFGGDVVGFLYGSVLVVTIVPLQALTVYNCIISETCGK